MANFLLPQISLPELLGGITRVDSLEKHEKVSSRKQQKRDFRVLSAAVGQDPEAKKWLEEHKGLYGV